MPTPDSSPTLLSAQVTVRYPGKAPVLQGISLDIARGEVVGLVGQSGSGRARWRWPPRIAGPPTRHCGGQDCLSGTDLLTLRERELRSLRGRALSLVLQSPLASLNPALEIGTQLREAWRATVSARHIGRLRSGDPVILENVSLPCGGNDRDSCASAHLSSAWDRRNAY